MIILDAKVWCQGFFIIFVIMKEFSRDGKTIWYTYKEGGKSFFNGEKWILSNEPLPAPTGTVYHYSAKMYRLDECIDDFYKQLNKT